MMEAPSSSSDSGNKFHKTSSSIRNLNQTLDKEDFTDDIWSEICLHLPIKSIYKFRCVSKKISLTPPPPPRSSSPLSALVCESFSSQASANYKVVRIPHFLGDSDKFNIEIFSSELGVWNAYQVLCPQVVTWEFSAFISAMIISKGILYWIEGKNKLIAYNINETNTSTCGLIDLPYQGDTVNVSRQTIRGMTFAKILNRCLGEAEGLVCFAQIHMKRTLSVWVLEGEKWHVLHKDIDLHDIINEIKIKLRSYYENTQMPPNGFNVRQPQLLGFSPIDRNVVIFGTCNYVWAYNIRTGTHEELCSPFFVSNKIVPSDKYWHMCFPLVLKPMPTILPPPSWTSPPMNQVQQKPSVPEL